jgi:hypothetical protein
LAHRIVVLNKGRIVCAGTPDEVKSLDATPPGTSGNRSLKIIRCSTTLLAPTLFNVRGVTSVTLEGNLATLNSTQPEATLRELLVLDQARHSLEVQALPWKMPSLRSPPIASSERLEVQLRRNPASCQLAAAPAKEHPMSTMTVAPAAVSPVNALTLNLKIFLREARYEFLRLSRTRSFALSIIGFPVAFYLFFGLIMNRGERIGSLSVAKYMLAGYAVFGMVGASLFGVGVALASDHAVSHLSRHRFASSVRAVADRKAPGQSDGASARAGRETKRGSDSKIADNGFTRV